MKSKVVAAYDKKAEAYMQPAFFQTLGMAERAFSDAVNQNDTPFAKHPEDFDIFQLGEYDDQTGLLESLHRPVLVCTAASLKRVQG